MKIDAIVILVLNITPLFGQNDSLINQYNAEGNRHGQWIQYFDSCELLSGAPAEIHMEFDNGILTGSYEVYNAEKLLTLKYNIVNGERSGTGYQYYRSGKIYRIYYHTADRVAYTIVFDLKGRIFQEYLQTDGIVVGTMKSYRRGKLWILQTYNEEGQLDGPYIYYYRNGQIEHELYFQNGDAVTQKRFNRRGKLKVKFGREADIVN